MDKTVSLPNMTKLKIIPTKPFNFDGTFNKPSHYPDGLSLWEKGKCWQTIRLDGRIFGLRIDNKGTIDSPEIYVSVFHEDPLDAKDVERIKEELIWRFDLCAYLKRIQQACHV